MSDEKSVEVRGITGHQFVHNWLLENVDSLDESVLTDMLLETGMIHRVNMDRLIPTLEINDYLDDLIKDHINDHIQNKRDEIDVSVEEIIKEIKLGGSPRSVLHIIEKEFSDKVGLTGWERASHGKAQRIS